MKKFYTTLLLTVITLAANAQGWPANYGGVMLQGFYWNSWDFAKWPRLESQADEFAGTFDLIWIPQSGNCNGTSMGYDDFYWFPGGNHYTSSFGTEAQLRSMINTFKSKGIGTIADVVINHRRNVSSWIDFPTETYNGVTYSMGSTDITGNDDGGKTKTNNPGVTFGANDTGEDWSGMRDLDHTSTNVQNICKAYTKMLMDDLGYTGFRYDMVKGYSASYTAMYNDYAKPQFSVGECWDGTATIANWINGTKLNGTGQPLSAAFDFQFRYTVRNAMNNGDMRRLGQQNDGNYPLVYSTTRTSYQSQFDTYQYAVTFVENHDTESRIDGNTQDPLRKDTLAANAWLIANPGTPCIWSRHWVDYKDEIKSMIAARKLAGIVNTSTYANMTTQQYYYGRAVKNASGANALLVLVGSNIAAYTPAAATWVEILSGYHYKYYMARALNTAWADKASGPYDGAFQVKLTAVAADGTQLVYTTNGTTPTASNGTRVASGSTINISANTQLKVGVLVNGSVTGVIERNYTIKEVQEWSLPECATYVPGKLFAYFENSPYWGAINVWVWNSSTQNLYSAWPGSPNDVTKVGTNPSTGFDVYRWEHEPTASFTAENIAGIIFNDGGSSQTQDLKWKNGAYYYLENLSTQTNYKTVITESTGINDITMDETTQRATDKVFTIDGKYVGTRQSLPLLQKGIYVVGGKKYVVR